MRQQSHHPSPPNSSALNLPSALKVMFLFKGKSKGKSTVLSQMPQKKVVLKLTYIVDEKTKHRAMEAVADIKGVNSIESDLEEKKLTVKGEMDTVTILKKLKKFGSVDIIS